MKTSKYFLVAVLMISMTAVAFASSPSVKNRTVDWQKAELNYLYALNSNNIGVRQSAATYLGEYKLKGAVNDLIIVLQTDKIESSRMGAALALIQIGEMEGIQAVEEAVIYDGSEKVAKYCEQLIQKAAEIKDLSLK